MGDTIIAGLGDGKDRPFPLLYALSRLWILKIDHLIIIALNRYKLYRFLGCCFSAKPYRDLTSVS
jgi:hypothetical protein